MVFSYARSEQKLKRLDLAGKVILTCSFSMNADDTDLVVAHDSSGAEELAKRVPGARVVAAFNTVPSEVLFSVFEAKGSATGPSIVYCGDDRSGKRVADPPFTKSPNKRRAPG